jgi:hypothetical protein
MTDADAHRLLGNLTNGQYLELIERMERFAATARNDTISVRVARVAERLGHAGAPFEKPLSNLELQVIQSFMKEPA